MCGRAVSRRPPPVGEGGADLPADAAEQHPVHDRLPGAVQCMPMARVSGRLAFGRQLFGAVRGVRGLSYFGGQNLIYHQALLQQ